MSQYVISQHRCGAEKPYRIGLEIRGRPRMTTEKKKDKGRKVEVFIFRAAERDSSNHSGREFLLLRRPPDRDARWQPVTGSVEVGEGFAEGAIREVWEETGLLAHKSDLVGPVYEFQFENRGGRTVTEKVFGLLTGNFEARLSHEHDTFEWLNFEEAVKRLHFDANKDGLKALGAFLDKESK